MCDAQKGFNLLDARETVSQKDRVGLRERASGAVLAGLLPTIKLFIHHLIARLMRNVQLTHIVTNNAKSLRCQERTHCYKPNR
jgi:hypothetical protein